MMLVSHAQIAWALVERVNRIYPSPAAQ